MRTEMGWSTTDRIVVRGKDLAGELLGKINLGDMAWLELTGRMPTANESRMFNAMLVTLVEHGVTPSAIAARMTYLGAPEAMQAAVAAGLCGLGSVFVGSTEGCAKMLMENDSVESILEEYKHIPGLGHPIHKPVDPRSTKLFEIAKECGFFGPYCGRIIKLSEIKKLTLNATGAIGAIPSR
jgi:citrate synthase